MELFFGFLNVKIRKFEFNFILLEIYVKILLVLELLKKYGGNVFWYVRVVYVFYFLWI